jgi:hypothetical protein
MSTSTARRQGCFLNLWAGTGLQLLLEQLHKHDMKFHGVVGGGPKHYVVNPTQVEVESRLSWAVTIGSPRKTIPEQKVLQIEE